jgi:type IV secretory pathway VirB2 component (pilin)
MFRILGWLICALGALVAIGAMVEFYALFASWTGERAAPATNLWQSLQGPLLSSLCALALIVLGLRFLLRARRAARRVKSKDAARMTDLFS